MTHVSSLGYVGNCSVAMTWSMEALVEDFSVELKIHALLVDNQDYCITRKQCLDKASEAIVPDFFDSSIDINVNFVDLGKGKVCVFIGGVTGRECVLCVLVLGLLVHSLCNYLFLCGNPFY
ncbi:hypothetical protein PIB30_073191 [Stylosanthes scabra]|uniref:Uncharacterized protein n=1 Tax=Stylosanthes scabra TaxID=79078 RepID=A0ABU6XMK1_9FABA|nr:hypothetical protein [Stylosanthes scabra]